MSRYAIKFPFRVRIHGGEFDESARAIHREDGLKTIQAELGIVLESTIERKQMSTKTTFKRIALVTVAALGFGVMSVAPSNAAVGTSDSLTAAVATTTGTVNVNADNIVTTRFFGETGDTAAFVVSLISAPSASSALPTIAVGGGTNVKTDTATISGGTRTASFAATSAGIVTGFATVKFTPDVVGEYKIGIRAGAGQTAPALTWTVTVAAKAAATAASVGNTTGSTLVYGPAWNYNNGVNDINSMGGVYANPDSATTAALVTAGGVSCYTDLGYGNPCVTGRIVLSNGASGGAALTNADAPKLTYVVTGPGLVRLNTTDANWTGALTTQGSTVAYETADAWTGTPGSLTKTFLLYSTGIPGTIKLTISSGTTVIATVSAVAFGNAKTITPTVVNNPIVKSATNTGTITAVVKDETGALVRGAVVRAVSSDTTVISNSYTACTTSTSAGVVSCDLAAVAAGSANITLTTNTASTVTTGISAAPVSVRVSDGVATKVDYAFDKATYYPGEAAVITATVSNAAGVMPAGSYTVLTAAVTGNYTLTGTPLLVVNPADNTGTVKFPITIPVGISGALTLTGTAATGITATFGRAEVVNAALTAAQEATDAANEATDAGNNAKDAADQAIEAADAATIAAQDAADAATAAGEMAVAAAEAAGAIAQDALDAANAATDAALSAAEAADAATAAATDAKDAADAATAAVAELSTKVAALMAALNAKVTTLSNLVAKIAKKVKA